MKKIVAKFRRNDVRGREFETTAKKVTTLQTAMTKKGRQSVFKGKIGVTRQLPPRVTPTLVTPLRLTFSTDR